MRGFLTVAVLAAGVLMPGAASNAQNPGDPLPCQYGTMEAAQCDMGYRNDINQCSVLPAGEQAGCNATAAGTWGMCMAEIRC